jgi:hypothetical protein
MGYGQLSGGTPSMMMPYLDNDWKLRADDWFALAMTLFEVVCSKPLPLLHLPTDEADPEVQKVLQGDARYLGSRLETYILSFWKLTTPSGSFDATKLEELWQSELQEKCLAASELPSQTLGDSQGVQLENLEDFFTKFKSVLEMLFNEPFLGEKINEPFDKKINDVFEQFKCWKACTSKESECCLI